MPCSKLMMIPFALRSARGAWRRHHRDATKGTGGWTLYARAGRMVIIP
ncbi:hypothetical protein KCP78_21590 [Salmonella enterica subsp. enterica]|nr:hypothetical protein KCP78_21590 [Salmonella enterica subsp. enterica]